MLLKFACGLCPRVCVLQHSRTSFLELLQAGRHRLVSLLAALFALAPDALARAGTRHPALLACVPFALVRAEARAPALPALAPPTLVLADARPRRAVLCGAHPQASTVLRASSAALHRWDCRPLASPAFAGRVRPYFTRGCSSMEREVGRWATSLPTSRAGGHLQPDTD